jgi:hypothetical protein
LNPHPRSGRRLPRRRAGALRSRRPLTRWAPFLLLLLSLGIAATAIYHTAQASRSHRATAEGLIRDYAAFAAWNLRQHVSARIRRSFDLALEPVIRAPAGSGLATSVTVAELLARNQSPEPVEGPVSAYTVSSYFRVPLGEGEATFAGELPTQEERNWITAIVREHATRNGDTDWDIVADRSPMDGGERFLVYAKAGLATAEPVAYGLRVRPAPPCGALPGRPGAEASAPEVADERPFQR